MIAADVQNVFLNSSEFGEVATYTPSGDSPATVTGVWEDGGGKDGMGAAVEEREDRRLTRRVGMWTMSAEDVATVTIDADELTRGGIVYVVKAVTTEGGIHRCECVQKETRSVAQKDRRFL